MSTLLRWRKTSRSDHTDCVEVGYPPLQWRKSSRSAENDCVEVAATAVRDSKNPGPTLHFPAPNLAAFLKALA
ncbi:MAG TPA: DUF397 domain-containing protein [Actinophytocola sp.]|jgi:hypothetical protein|uniref:DUF397 domain-containing protein n=1 Tax=Actinophytocola sp. TaxID=1872138 RepID=UPI002E09C445|nr:DUF397 domain-containing protein [Actinophytocola sp.]